MHYNSNHKYHSEPLRLCQFLLSCCLAKGVRLHHPAEVLSIHRDSCGNLSNVLISYENSAEVLIPCTHLLLAAGAWTPGVFSSLFPNSALRIPISSLAGHSVLHYGLLPLLSTLPRIPLRLQSCLPHETFLPCCFHQ